MRTPIIAGNWKMFKTVPEAESFIAEIKGKAEVEGVETVICAPFTNLPALVAAAKVLTSRLVHKTYTLKITVLTQARSVV